MKTSTHTITVIARWYDNDPTVEVFVDGGAYITLSTTQARALGIERPDPPFKVGDIIAFSNAAVRIIGATDGQGADLLYPHTRGLAATVPWTTLGDGGWRKIGEQA